MHNNKKSLKMHIFLRNEIYIVFITFGREIYAGKASASILCNPGTRHINI